MKDWRPFSAFLNSQEGQDCVSSESDDVIPNHVDGRSNGSGSAEDGGKPKLTREQQAVVDSLLVVLPGNGLIIRATSGAGTGKVCFQHKITLRSGFDQHFRLPSAHFRI